MTNNFKSIFSREQVMILLKNDIKKKVDENKNKGKANSPYGQMLRESKKISLFYGNLSKKYLQKIFYKSCNQPSKISENIFLILESRLDIILYRSGFFESIASAKQMIRIGGIKVNDKKIISSSSLVMPGDVISIFGEKNKKKLLFLPSASQQVSKKKLGGRRFKGSPALFSLISKSCKICASFSEMCTTRRLESKIDTTSIAKHLVINSGKKTNKNDLFSVKAELIQFRELLILINNIKNCLTLNYAEINVCALSSSKVEVSASATALVEEKLSNFFLLDSIAKFTKNTIHYNTENRFFQWLTKVSVSTKKSFNNILEGVSVDFKEAAKIKRQKDENDFSTYFVFLNYLLNLKKHYLSLQKKKINYKRQQHWLLFKNQNFVTKHFDLKKTKPLHLEISYRSLSIIFLFPPQRIIFPFFANPSLIYK